MQCLRTRATPSAAGPFPGPSARPARGRRPNTNPGLEAYTDDARPGMLPGLPGSAMCVQRLDGSLNSAIHTTYRILLRSSSMPEPRDPLLKVFMPFRRVPFSQRVCAIQLCGTQGVRAWQGRARGPLPQRSFNDPSAGSPTERFECPVAGTLKAWHAPQADADAVRLGPDGAPAGCLGGGHTCT